MEKVKKTSLADGKMIKRAIKDSFIKLSPMTEAKNPVMFLVYVSAILTTGLFVLSLVGIQDAPAGFIFGWRSSCGSLSFSLTLRRRLPKEEERPRQTL